MNKTIRPIRISGPHGHHPPLTPNVPAANRTTVGGAGQWEPGDAAGRGRPPEAAARRAGLEFVEKLLTTNLTSADTTAERSTPACSRVAQAPRVTSNALAARPGTPG